MHGCNRQQQSFDFNRASKLALMDQLVIPRDFALKRLGPTRQLLARMKAVIRAVDSFAGDDSHCWATVASIGRVIGWCERQTQYALREAQALDLIRIEDGRRALTKIHRINWSLILDWSSESAQGCKQGGGGVQTRTQRGANKVKKRVLFAPNPQYDPQVPATTIEKPFQPMNRLAISEEWAVVVVALDQENILAGSQSVQEASSNGVSAEFVMQLIEYARCRCLNGVRAFGPGALARRIGRARLGQAVDSLWPPASGAYQSELEREKSRRTVKAETTPELDRIAAAASVELQSLEENFGAEYAALGAEDVREMARADEKLARSLMLCGGRTDSPMLRGTLLKSLAARKEKCV